MLTPNADFALVLTRLREIIRKLHSQPRFCCASEGLGQADRHLGADARLAVNYVVQRLAADAENFGRIRNR